MFKILLVGNFGYGWDGSICDEENIAKALEKLGHTVFRVQREQTKEAHWKLPKADFALVAQWDNYNADLVDRLRNFFVPKVIYWAFDYQADGQVWHKRLVNQSDLYLSKPISDARYSNWRWACDFAPDFLHAVNTGLPKDIDVLFTGTYLSAFPERIDLLKAIDERFNLTIHSINPHMWIEHGFKNVAGPVMDEGLPELIARAKVNIAIDNYLEAGYWSDRAAQIMACGGFVLHRYVPPIEAYFHSNIAYFFDKEDCLEKIQWWLEHDEDRDVIAAEALENSAYYKAKERVADVLNIIRDIL